MPLWFCLIALLFCALNAAFVVALAKNAKLREWFGRFADYVPFFTCAAAVLFVVIYEVISW